MECLACKEKINLAGNTNECEMCAQKNKPSESVINVVNDVVYYIHFNSKRASMDTLAECCEKNFFIPTITEASKYPISTVHDKLMEIDEDLATEAAKVRKESKHRSKSFANIAYMYNILKALYLLVCILYYTSSIM